MRVNDDGRTIAAMDVLAPGRSARSSAAASARSGSNVLETPSAFTGKTRRKLIETLYVPSSLPKRRVGSIPTA
jgi:hypothetical protein